MLFENRYHCQQHEAKRTDSSSENAWLRAFFREGGKHTVYVNRVAQATSSVPRHREINDFLAHKICRELKVPEPKAA